MHLMLLGWAPERPRLAAWLVATSTAAAAMVSAALYLWPPQWNVTLVGLIALFAVAEAHPVHVPQATRVRAVVAGEAIVAVAALALPPGQASWVAILGALLAVPVTDAFCPYDLMRHPPRDRTVLNVGKNILGPAPLVLLAALAAPHGPLVVALATAVGLAVHGTVTYALVEGAIRRASGASAPRTTPRDAIVEGLPLAGILVAVAIPLGLVLRGHPQDWPLLLLLGLGLVFVSRARMGEDHAGTQAAAAAKASALFATARDVSELEGQLCDLLGSLLRCRTVRLVRDESHPGAPASAPSARVGDSGPWVVADHRTLAARWSRLDADVLRTVVAIAAPERRRLALLAEVREAERFASLVLSAAGHDIGNRLQTAAAATETLRTWQDQLAPERQHALLTTAESALRQANSLLRDLVAVGARGLGASTSGAELALFTRSVSADLRIDAANVQVAAPSTVVQRALENLVHNAIRHHTGPGPVEVSILADSATTVQLEVRDRGPGLAPDMVETLFQPFSQLTDDRRRAGSLGLGLFIARGLAESVGGSLTYRDRPGGGSVFVMTLPSAGQHDPEGVEERVVFGPGPDGDPQAAAEAWFRGEVPHQDPLAE